MALQATRHARWSESPPAAAPERTRARASRWVLLAVAGWATAAAVGFVAASEWRKADGIARLAGMTAVSGRGVEITLVDSRQPAGAGPSRPTGLPVKATPHPAQAPQLNQAVVTDGDLILLNMLLWYGGAHAVSINNQRITAQTTITSSGPVILINGTRTVGPFRITALGDPDTLKGVLTEAGLIEQMRGAGITVSMSAQPVLQVLPWHPNAEAAVR
jgi:uncharacterized protein YlxW (UPF0749 family)